MKALLVALLLVSACWGQEAKSKPEFESIKAASDANLGTNPDSAFWRGARPVYMEGNRDGKAQPEYRTEVRSRWTKKYVYFLFVCPYKELYLKPNPDTKRETYELWNWNVAEVFLGSNFQDINRYKEFELSPHNEWIDLDVNLNEPHHEKGWVWNSGFEHVTRVDEAKHVWYAAMRIPFAALDTAAPKAGMTFRANLYRTEGSGDRAKEILWQPTMSQTFHVPERFGTMKLSAK